jgi:hypothetical protein
MMLDQPAADFHDLDKVNLVAVWRLARILPNQHSTTVGQPLAGAIPAHQVVWPASRALLEKMPQFSVTAQNSIQFSIENRRDERTLQHRVLGVEGEQPLGIAS